MGAVSVMGMEVDRMKRMVEDQDKDLFVPALHETILADPLTSFQSCPQILTHDNWPAPQNP